MDEKCQHCNDNGYVLLAYSREICDQCHGTGRRDAGIEHLTPTIREHYDRAVGGGYYAYCQRELARDLTLPVFFGFDAAYAAPTERDTQYWVDWVGRGVKTSNNPWSFSWPEDAKQGEYQGHWHEPTPAAAKQGKYQWGSTTHHILQPGERVEDAINRASQAGLERAAASAPHPTLKPGERAEDAINRSIAESQIERLRKIKIEAERKRQGTGQRVTGSFRYGGGGEVTLDGSLIRVEKEQPARALRSGTVVIKEDGGSETELLSALAELRDTGTLALMDLSGATIVTADHAFIERGGGHRQWIFHCSGLHPYWCGR